MNYQNVNTSVTYSIDRIPSLVSCGVSTEHIQVDQQSTNMYFYENLIYQATSIPKVEYSQAFSVFLQWQIIKNNILQLFDVQNIDSVTSFLRVNSKLVEILYEAKEQIINAYQKVEKLTLELHNDPEERTQTLLVGIVSNFDSAQAALKLVSLIGDWLVNISNELSSKIAFVNHR